MILVYIPKADKTGEYRHKVTQFCGTEFPGKSLEFRAADAYRSHEMETKDCEAVVVPTTFEQIAIDHQAVEGLRVCVIAFNGPVAVDGGYTHHQPGDDSVGGAAQGSDADDDEDDADEDDIIAQEMLINSATKLGPLLEGMNDVAFLERMIALEEDGKNRKGVIKLISERLSAL